MGRPGIFQKRVLVTRFREIIRKVDFSARGFTTMELFITLAIITTVIAIAYPLFQRLAINGNLRSAARDMMADFSSLKQRAMAENAIYQISFDIASNSYLIRRVQPPPPSPPQEPQPRTKTPANFSKDIKIQNVAFSAGTIVTFETRGLLNPAGHLTLINSRGSTAKITCNLSGRIYVQFIMQ